MTTQFSILSHPHHYILGAADSAGGGAGEGGADIAPADLKEAAGLPASSGFDGGGHGERLNAKSREASAEEGGFCVGYMPLQLCEFGEIQFSYS